MALSSKAILEWKRTTTQYVAILERLDRFEPGSIREIARRGPETILGGVLRTTGELDWYALAYSRQEVDFAEARALAQAALERYRQGKRT
jgi:hypothetical protein